MRRFLITAAVSLALAASVQAAGHKNTIQQLTSIFENSSTDFQYTFVSNIGDGRGETFGFVGFTSGTYSGTLFLKQYQALRPNNPLVAFLPAFKRIDAEPHDREGRNADVAGLEAFPVVFATLGGDPEFRRAQRMLADRLSWIPAQSLAKSIGAKDPLTQGELYDAYVNHGEDGVRTLIRKTNRKAGGTPRSGVSEKKWLSIFLKVRLAVLAADSTWIHAIDRIVVYQTLLAERNYRLRLPLNVSCYGNNFQIP